MYEMLILSHGALAEGYHQTMKMILGEEPDIIYCALEEDDSSEDLEKKIHTCIHWQNSMPLLVLADIYSGSPCRSAITQLFSSSKKSYLIAGISLPLVMEAYLQRNGELSQIVDNLISVAKENVINVNELLLKTKQNMEDE